jgi:hypothetical protein
MPKRDPWAKPKDSSWIKLGAKIAPIPPSAIGLGYSDWEPDSITRLPNKPTPRDMPTYVISKIEVTGNGTKMVTLHREGDPSDGGCRWSSDLERKWRPAPKPVKPSILTRFERMVEEDSLESS